jgi:hypothetical protein
VLFFTVVLVYVSTVIDFVRTVCRLFNRTVFRAQYDTCQTWPRHRYVATLHSGIVKWLGLPRASYLKSPIGVGDEKSRVVYTTRLASDDSLRLSHSFSKMCRSSEGTLLLIFYLLIDRRDIPLIIDQPEDNLDNQTVYDMLVACLREARSRRQVIIVTHNPNLGVVSDADQIIHSQIDKQNNRNKVTYTSGSIENPVTNGYSITVLEGTRPAFVHREQKYQSDT